MHNIHLIFTRHYEGGNCNASELYKLIKSVKPEVIFEELSHANFQKSYQENKLVTLETNAIKMYLIGHPINHLPVDTLDRPKLYDEDVDRMLDRITNDNRLPASKNFRYLINQLIAYTSRYGFQFLNSRYNDELMEKFEILKETILNQLNEDRLFQISKLERDTIDKREDVMLANIYQYSRENEYCRGLFFIGSGHRQSILQKVEKYNEMETPKLNWTYTDHSLSNR